MTTTVPTTAGLNGREGTGNCAGGAPRQELLHRVRVGANLALESGRVHRGAVRRHGEGVGGGGVWPPQHHEQVPVLHPARGEHVGVAQLAPVEHHRLRAGGDARLHLEDGLPRASYEMR